MSDGPRGNTAFFTCVGSRRQVRCGRLLLDSIRAFGGELRNCPFWVVEVDPEGAPCGALADIGATVVPLAVPASIDGYAFARKVCACARAEELAAGSVETLIWLIPESLILKPPELLELPSSMDVAVRPVHIRNVGLPAGEVPDAFWGGVFAAVGEPPDSFTVESFIEGERIRPYFNSAAFSVRPVLGLMRTWLRFFETLVTDDAFQEEACGDERHRVFLHQAVLSALIATSVDRARIRELPPDYGYPYNLHGLVPVDRRAAALADTVCAIYEDRSVDPREVTDIEIQEPLRSWLAARSVRREA